MSILVSLLIFSFIVFIHELGHYVFARRAGIAVTEFAIGMGPKVIGFRRNKMDWTIRLFPIGGFCKMVGEDGTDETLSEEKLKELNGGLFFEKNVWQRIRTVFGGPLFNFLLALVFSFLYVSLSATSSNYVGSVMEGSPAEIAGIQVGDKIVSIDNHMMITPTESRIYINVPKGKEIRVEVERKNDTGKKEKLAFLMTPDFLLYDEANPETSDKFYYIGVGYEAVEKTFFSIIKHGVLECASWIKIVFYSLSLLFTGQVSLSALSGPVAIVNEISSGYEASLVDGVKAVIENISFYIVLLSANLGVMNLLPLPALDGGRLIFLLIEAIRKKPVAPNKEGFIHFIGFAFLMVLMVFVLFNDIKRIFL
ncbi:MAG: RIP metalloprotease RseP [Vallitaleaceae bacterium]|nr:RIP metalloprotease RseP [Vallitaleaceae bacterium]